MSKITEQNSSENQHQPCKQPESDLYDRFEFRAIRPDEDEQAAEIERVCFPPNEACSKEMMLTRAAAAPELFLVAANKETGQLAGFLNGLATDEDSFRDEFFTDAGLHNPEGRTVMLLGLDVLPEYRMQGLAKELMRIFLHRQRRQNKNLVLLTCLDSKVTMYQNMGFLDKGIANSSWGGEQWHEMSYTIHP